MIRTRALFPALLAVLSTSVFAEQIPAGTWKQVSSTAGDCSDCEIRVTRSTPHILQITSSNGWIGYAHYIQKEDRYRGVFQWEAGQGGEFDNVLFNVELTYQAKTLSLSARSVPLSFTSTFRKK